MKKCAQCHKKIDGNPGVTSFSSTPESTVAYYHCIECCNKNLDDFLDVMSKGFSIKKVKLNRITNNEENKDNKKNEPNHT